MNAADADAGAGTGFPLSDSTNSDIQDLQSSLAGLSGLVSGAWPLQELLTRVSIFAAQAIPGADGAGVTLLKLDQEKDIVQALAASAEFVSEIDAIQYEVLGEGPCITAAYERRTVRSGSLGGEAKWPRFGPRVSRKGVHSVLSLPLPVFDQVVGAINAYAYKKDAFDEQAEKFGESFAAPAAVAVHNAQVLAQAVQVATQLETALTSRTVIDQAIGILRSRTGGTADEAFAALRGISQAENKKLSVVAQRVVDEAVRRARARHTSK